MPITANRSVLETDAPVLHKKIGRVGAQRHQSLGVTAPWRWGLKTRTSMALDTTMEDLTPSSSVTPSSSELEYRRS